MSLHESIVDRDNKNLASGLDLGVGHVAWDVGVGAGRAFNTSALSFKVQLNSSYKWKPVSLGLSD